MGLGHIEIFFYEVYFISFMNKAPYWGLLISY